MLSSRKSLENVFIDTTTYEVIRKHAASHNIFENVYGLVQKKESVPSRKGKIISCTHIWEMPLAAGPRETEKEYNWGTPIRMKN